MTSNSQPTNQNLYLAEISLEFQQQSKRNIAKPPPKLKEKDVSEIFTKLDLSKERIVRRASISQKGQTNQCSS